MTSGPHFWGETGDTLPYVQETVAGVVGDISTGCQVNSHDWTRPCCQVKKPIRQFHNQIKVTKITLPVKGAAITLGTRRP